MNSKAEVIKTEQECEKKRFKNVGKMKVFTESTKKRNQHAAILTNELKCELLKKPPSTVILSISNLLTT